MFRCLIESLIVIALASCAPLHAYHGASRTDVALIRGFSTFCDGALEIRELDGEFSGRILEIPEGRHHMTIEYTSRPFYSEGDSAKQFLACITLSTHSVEFDARTGKTYWFYVDERSHEGHALSVWESTDVGPHGERVAARVNQLRSRRRCALDWRYLRCLSPDGYEDPF